MANKNVILDLNGKIITILNEGQDPSPHLVDGARNIIVPESYLSNPVNQENSLGQGRRKDPRTELKLTMQTGTKGTGCTAGITSGITGCGIYSWNETVLQNISTVDARKRTNSTAVVYAPHTKKFGTSSARFNGAGGGSSGGVLLLNDLPGLTLAGIGGHIGGASGASGAGVSGGYSGDVLIKFWFNLDSVAGSDDMVLCTQGNTSGGGTSNSWKLYWHASANELKFAFNNQGDTPTSFAHSATIAAANKVTAGQWHHCAVIYKSRWFGSNGSEVVTYFNGASAGSVKTDVSGELLRSDQPIAIGAFKDGYYPLTGYMDDFHMLMGPSGGTVCRGFSGPTYSTAGVSGGATLDRDATLALMRFNGQSGCELFSVDNYERVKAKVTYWNNSEKILGVRDVVLTGNVVSGFDYDYGYIEGFRGNGHYQLSCTGGTFMSGTEKRAMKTGQFRQAMNEYFGLVGISGNSGSSGSSPRPGGTPGMANLFGPHSGAGHGEPNFHGVHTTGFSTRITDGKMNEIKEIVEFINTDGGTPGCGVDNFIIQDTLSNAVGFSPGHCFALYQDMFAFRRDVQEQVINATVEVNNASTADANSYSEISSIELNSTITRYQPEGYDPEGSGKYDKGTRFSSGVNSEEMGAPPSTQMGAGKG